MQSDLFYEAVHHTEYDPKSGIVWACLCWRSFDGVWLGWSRKIAKVY